MANAETIAPPRRNRRASSPSTTSDKQVSCRCVTGAPCLQRALFPRSFDRGPGLAVAADMGTARTTRNTALDVLELLENQHTEVDALIEQLERGEGDMQAVFVELA